MSVVMRARALPGVARPCAVRRSQLQSRPARFVKLVAFSSVPEIEQKLDAAVKDAEEICADGKAQDCAVAWDTVEELAAAASHKKVQEKVDAVDPLEEFCKDNPETDECRVYED